MNLIRKHITNTVENIWNVLANVVNSINVILNVIQYWVDVVRRNWNCSWTCEYMFLNLQHLPAGKTIAARKSKIPERNFIFSLILKLYWNDIWRLTLSTFLEDNNVKITYSDLSIAYEIKFTFSSKSSPKILILRLYINKGFKHDSDWEWKVWTSLWSIWKAK